MPSSAAAWVKLWWRAAASNTRTAASGGDVLLIEDAVYAATSGNAFEAKLREVGFSEGDEVEMLGYGPFGGRTLAVRLNRTIIALRGPEAALVEVEPA